MALCQAGVTFPTAKPDYLLQIAKTRIRFDCFRHNPCLNAPASGLKDPSLEIIMSCYRRLPDAGVNTPATFRSSGQRRGFANRPAAELFHVDHLAANPGFFGRETQQVTFKSFVGTGQQIAQLVANDLGKAHKSMAGKKPGE